MATELKLHDRIVRTHLRIGEPVEGDVFEILSFITTADGESVRCTGDVIFPRWIAEDMREHYVEAEKAGRVVVLATDLDGNPLAIAII